MLNLINYLTQIFKILIFLIKIYLIILGLSFFLIKSSFSIEKNQIIRHAGGSIDNETYTNSLESLKKSIEEGYDFIELDMIASLDNKIIFTHDWQTFFRQTGETINTPITKNEYLKRKILNKYTPIDSKNLNIIMSENQNIYIVTDKLNDFKLIQSTFQYFDRVIIEIFGMKNYIKSFFYKNLKNENRLFSTHLVLRHKIFIKILNIKKLAVPCNYVIPNKEFLKKHVQNDGEVFCWTENDPEIIKNYLDEKLITKAYSDHL